MVASPLSPSTTKSPVNGPTLSATSGWSLRQVGVFLSVAVVVLVGCSDETSPTDPVQVDPAAAPSHVAALASESEPLFNASLDRTTKQFCPDGWIPAAPPLNPVLKCVPNTFTARRAEEPIVVARANPGLFCPDGWVPAAPPWNPALKCLPNTIVLNTGRDPLVVEIPASFKEPLTVYIPKYALPRSE